MHAVAGMDHRCLGHGPQPVGLHLDRGVGHVGPRGVGLVLPDPGLSGHHKPMPPQLGQLAAYPWR